MRNILAITLAGVFALASVATNAAESLSHADLLKKVRDKERIQEQVNEQRVQQFRSQRNRQQQLLADAKARLAAEEAKSERLKAAFDENEKQLTKIAEDLRIKQGNLGELFGVVRQAANSMTGDIANSLVSAQYPGRQSLLNNLTEADSLPKMEQLRAFWVLMLQEMSEQGETTTFTADVVNEAGRTEQQTVTRVGTFNLVSGGEYLFFDKGVIKTLQVQPDSRVLSQVEEFASTNSGYAGLFLDPSKGAILQLEKQKMSLLDRLWEFSGFAGKTVMVLLVIGLLIALERIFTLYFVTGPKVQSQKKSSTPGNNPLGRIMKVYQANRNEDVENLELKLDEAVLKETPKIERGINLIKVIAALGPLLGLLGTVVGMIEVFQSITLYGTGDPKTMADGISQALVTTVWGLLAAIPLTFLHAVVAGKSKNIIHVLEEQSTGLMAQHEESNS
ncbi:MAG: MotA/TolQ/ExbB proton channel family protein [Kangiella sp.]|jgi:biopolymer transport protein ExbB|nr:MotA/TolQ/ExbB proton channel family protein [Kangiella sp.]MCW9028635.1 MotA/TolQ/ExbB proton channel family protein [Kangiella sp.]